MKKGEHDQHHQQDFTLCFDFYVFDELFWLKNFSPQSQQLEIEQLVFYKSRKQKGLSFRKPLPSPKRDMIFFLYNEAKSIMEDPKLKDKPFKQRLSVYLTLLTLYPSFEHSAREWKQLIDEFYTWTLMLEANIKKTVQESSLSISSAIETFQKNVEYAQNNAASPIQDLSGYLLPSSDCVNAEKFVKDFKVQAKNNIQHLSKIELTATRHHMNAQAQQFKLCMDYRVPNVFSPNTTLRLQKLYLEVMEMKETLMQLEEHSRTRTTWCIEILEPYQVEKYESLKPEVRNYYEKHEKTFSEIFGKEQKFPVLMPSLSELKDGLMEVTNEADFNSLKKIFMQVSREIDMLKNGFPKAWPVCVANLSTHDGYPELKVKDGADFELILTAYSSYLKTMTNIYNGWSLSLRRVFEFLDTMSCFSPNRDIIRESRPLENANPAKTFNFFEQKPNPPTVSHLSVPTTEGKKAPIKKAYSSEFQYKRRTVVIAEHKSGSQKLLSVKLNETPKIVDELHLETSTSSQRPISILPQIVIAKQKTTEHTDPHIMTKIVEVDAPIPPKSTPPQIEQHPPEHNNPTKESLSSTEHVQDNDGSLLQTPTLPHYTEWDIVAVGDWIDALNLSPDYKNLFMKNKVNGRKLHLVDQKVLEGFGISAWGDRVDILDNIETLIKQDTKPCNCHCHNLSQFLSQQFTQTPKQNN